jgi:CheY-like chemotaxis protein
MRSYQAGDTGARAPVVPGQTDQAAELCRLFNAIAERSALLETRTEPERADARDRAPAPRGAGQGPAALGEHTPAIVVFEDDAAGSLEPMRAAAESAVRGLGGTWERAGVLRVRTPAQVREAAAGGRVVCALLDARAPLEALLAVTDALGAAAPGVPVVLFAPDGNPLAGENAAAAVRDRDRAEIVRSSGQASERLTLHWLTSAPGADELTPETPDPGYGQARFEGEKVLIVDDDVRNIFAMVSALELYGLTALTADSGYEALEILQRTPDISVVLMDLMMPGLDGYGATARIRATPVGADLPIIAVTARSGESDREHSLAAGINEHVTKPVEVEHLLSLIRGLIRR